MSDEFYTVKEIAGRLKVRDVTVIDWIKKGQLKAYKFGREYRIKKEDYERFVEQHRADKKPDWVYFVTPIKTPILTLPVMGVKDLHKSSKNVCSQADSELDQNP